MRELLIIICAIIIIAISINEIALFLEIFKRKKQRQKILSAKV